MSKTKQLFKFPGGDWNKLEFDEAINGLISKGLAERIFIDGEEYFSFTANGEAVAAHLQSNDPKLKN